MASVLFGGTASTLHHTKAYRRRFALNTSSSRTLPWVRLSGEVGHPKTRGLSVVTCAVPGPSTYIFAFVFPLSLLVATIFTSIRIADKLDNDFLQETSTSRRGFWKSFA